MIEIRTVAAAVGLAILTTGCADIKPLQQQVGDLKTQVDRLSSEHHSLKAAADEATRTAQAAQTAAQQAQSRADAAAAAAQNAQQGVDAVNTKIDRMFKRSMSK